MPCSVCKKAGHNKTTCMVLIMKALDESRELVASFVEVARIAQLPTAKRTEKEGEALINMISTVALIAESKLARDKERKDEVESGSVKTLGKMRRKPRKIQKSPEVTRLGKSRNSGHMRGAWTLERRLPCISLLFRSVLRRRKRTTTQLVRNAVVDGDKVIANFIGVI